MQVHEPSNFQCFDLSIAIDVIHVSIVILGLCFMKEEGLMKGRLDLQSSYLYEYFDVTRGLYWNLNWFFCCDVLGIMTFYSLAMQQAILKFHTQSSTFTYNC